MPRQNRWVQEMHLKEYVSTRQGPQWDGQQGCLTIPKGHFLNLAGKLLARNQRIVIGREYDPLEACTASCQEAELPICHCSCRGRYHGGGRWMAGWAILEERDTRIGRQSWDWIVVTLSDSP